MLGIFTNLRRPVLDGGSGGTDTLVYAAVLVRVTRSTELFVLIRV